MANLEKGFERLTWVVASLLSCPGFLFGAVAVYGGDVVFARGMFLLAAIGFALPWVVFLTFRWIAHGFSAQVTLPIWNRTTGEVTLGGYEPGGADFPPGGAHATFPVSLREEALCGRCGTTSREAVIVATPDGPLCMKHAGWYAKRILIQHYALVMVFWIFALLGIATAAYFAWLWLTVSRSS